SHPVYLFLREFSLQDFRGGSVHYIRKGRTCIASMFRFNHDFEPVNKADADRIAEEIETAEHIKKLRDMRSKSRGNHGIIQPHTR
ncbi:DUF4222 domain-containing protein, partial [Escherichia coli]|uniref:DUF4222 domain-containing protein n=1 Tax=Escherichia coli TaxID=562 RepID=UPI00098AC5A4